MFLSERRRIGLENKGEEILDWGHTATRWTGHDTAGVRRTRNPFFPTSNRDTVSNSEFCFTLNFTRGIDLLKISEMSH